MEQRKIIMKKKIISTVVLISVIAAGVAFSGVSALAKGPQAQNGNREQVKNAIENNDYEAWKKLTEERNSNAKVLEKINASNFSKLKEMHQLMQDGKVDEANKIRQELGLPDRGEKKAFQNGFQKGLKQGHKNCNK